jgi:hypothetical protein
MLPHTGYSGHLTTIPAAPETDVKRANPPPGRGRKNKKREREKREKRGKRREKRKGKGKEGKERMLGRVCEPLIADLGLEMLTFNDDGLGNRKGRL